MGQQQPGFNQPEFQRPIFLSGKVMLADGTPPGEPVTIVRDCWGQRRPETYTDSKGRFSFQLGARNSLAFADASTSPASDVFGASPFLAPGMGFPRTNLMVAARPGRVQPCELEADLIRRRNSGGSGSQTSTGTPRVNAFGRVDLSGCELRASLPGYRSESIQLRNRSVFDNPNVGVIILHPLAKGQGISVSATSLAAPKQARKAYEKALKELRKKDAILWFAAVKAIEQLEKAVAEYPEYAKAWSLLGRTRLSINDKEGAREAFDKATKADPKYLGPYEALLRMELAEKRWAEVNLVSERLLNLNPHMTEVQYYRAVAAFNLGKMDLAEDLVLGIQSGEGSEGISRHAPLAWLDPRAARQLPSGGDSLPRFSRCATSGAGGKGLAPPTHRMGSPGGDPEGENGSLDDPGIPARSRRPFVNSDRRTKSALPCVCQESGVFRGDCERSLLMLKIDAVLTFLDFQPSQGLTSSQ